MWKIKQFFCKILCIVHHGMCHTRWHGTRIYGQFLCVQTIVNHHRHLQTCAPNRNLIPVLANYPIGTIVGLWSFGIVLNLSGARIAWMANIYRNSIWNTNEGVNYQQQWWAYCSNKLIASIDAVRCKAKHTQKNDRENVCFSLSTLHSNREASQ